eukprot:Skav206913  [mRNA]  locus=scaffold808:379673:388710:+ [translate_table: standard]
MGILDPEFVMFLRILLAARRFLHYASEEDRFDFLSIATAFQDTIAHVKGPASAFAYVLMELSWSINMEGLIHAKAFLSFSLYTCSTKRLRRFLEEAWLSDMIIQKTTRTKLFHSGNISRVDTVSILKHFPEKRHTNLLKHLAYGTQTVEQKLHWVPEEEGECPLCGQEDSRSHRLLHCPVGQDIREPFADFVHSYLELGSHAAEFSVVTQHAYYDAMQALHFDAAPAIIDATILTHVAKCKDQQVEINWYTDGSIVHPHTPTTSFGAFAVVLDLATSNSQRDMIALRSPMNLESISSLACVAAARVQGEQLILRAEIQAIATIITQVGYGSIFSDSSAACTMVQYTLRATTWQSVMHFEHCDLLLEIWEVRERVSVSIHHIKAHQDPMSTLNLRQRYHILGNAFADLKAKHAAHSLFPSFVATLEEMHRDMEDQRTMLKQVFDLHRQLLPIRQAAARQMDTGSKMEQQRSIQDVQTAFATWSPPSVCTFPMPTEFPELASCLWGEATAWRVLRWLAAIEWPEDNTIGPMGQNTGISWQELALSYVCHQQAWLPVIRPDKDNQQKVLVLGTHEQALEYGTTVTEQSTNLRLIIDQLIALSLQPLWPSELQRRKISSLYLQGMGAYTQGISSRPKVPGQPFIAKFLSDRFTGVSRSLSWLPVMALEPFPFEILDSTALEIHSEAPAAALRTGAGARCVLKELGWPINHADSRSRSDLDWLDAWEPPEWIYAEPDEQAPAALAELQALVRKKHLGAERVAAWHMAWHALRANKTAKAAGWKDHILAADGEPDTKTVVNYFQRLEFQDGKRKLPTQDYHGSGRVHVHSLDYLQNVEKIKLKTKISATAKTFFDFHKLQFTRPSPSKRLQVIVIMLATQWHKCNQWPLLT